MIKSPSISKLFVIFRGAFVYKYDFLGSRTDKNKPFYIDGINVSTKQWYTTGNCVTVFDIKSNHEYIFSEYYIYKDDTSKVIFAAGALINGKEAFYIRVDK